MAPSNAIVPTNNSLKIIDVVIKFLALKLKVFIVVGVVLMLKVCVIAGLVSTSRVFTINDVD
jgi:hypothetical protein